VPKLPNSAEKIAGMGWRDLQAVAAAFFVDELETASREGGEALLRLKLGGLSAGERRVLRDALADAPLS
jgi:hypothetical protein